MDQMVGNAYVAVLLGIPLAVLLFVPTAAYQYRRDGRLGPGDLLTLAAVAVYGWALWTYTLLPMPEPGSYQCRGRQLDPFGSIRAIDGRGADGLLGLLRDPAFLQVALNVLLFVPLGWLIRVVLRRGVLVAAGLGFGVSLLVESTQGTGLWHLYACPYRLFDVDDLAVNTGGAVLGSLLSLVLLGRRDGGASRPLPTSVSLGRRVVGMLSDVIVSVLVGGSVAAAYRGWGVYGGGTFDPDVQSAILLGVPFLVQAVWVLAAGRTVGEHVVAVRAVARRPGANPIARVVKLATGVTPVFVVVALAGRSGDASLTALAAVAAVNIVAAAVTEQHRGLSHVLAGMDLRVQGGPAGR